MARPSESFRQKLQRRLHSLRQRSQSFLSNQSDKEKVETTQKVAFVQRISQSTSLSPQPSCISPVSSGPLSNVSRRSSLRHGILIDHVSSSISVAASKNDDDCTPDGIVSDLVISTDLWSVAYREAIQNLGDDIDIALLKGRNVAELFVELQQIDEDATKESAFVRGIRHLHRVQVPLERFKLALDLANPLASLDPIAMTVFGVVRSVTAVSSVHSPILSCRFAGIEWSCMLSRSWSDCH